jgi:OCT family organic cation transporter-like MFS transporter 4/5
MYSGAEPSLKSCGSHVFDPKLTQKAKCAEFAQLQNRTNCKPVLVPQFESINYEWDYYCSDNKWVKQSISIQMIGIIVGALVFGQCSDLFGRKPALLVSLIGCIISMVSSSFTNGLILFTILRFFVNVFNGGCISVQLVFTVENLPKEHRFWISNMITWSPNIVIFAIIAYFSGKN